MKRVPNIIFALQVRRLSTERLSNLPQATQLANDRAETAGKKPHIAMHTQAIVKIK